MKGGQLGLLALCSVVSASCGGTDTARARADSATSQVDTVTGPREGAAVDSFDLAVSLLVERALNPSSRLQAFWGLEALGCRAVPAMVRRLDDRRPLSGGLSLVNTRPGAFEGMRHYSPRQMVDALAAILNQITAQDFGFIYNGAPDSSRSATVRGWREYLKRVGAEGVCPTGGA